MVFKRVFKGDLEKDLEGDLEGDLDGDLEGDFRLELKFNSLELDSEVGQLVIVKPWPQTLSLQP